MPTEVLTRATTFDLEVLDIAFSYERYKHDKANGKTPDIRQEDLIKVLEADRTKT